MYFFRERQTDGRTDGEADGRTDREQRLVSFVHKRITTIVTTCVIVVVIVVVVVVAAAADDDDDDVVVKLEAQLRTMRNCLLNLRREYNKLLDERTEYQV